MKKNQWELHEIMKNKKDQNNHPPKPKKPEELLKKSVNIKLKTSENKEQN